MNGHGSLYEKLVADGFDVVVICETSFFDLNYVIKVVRFLTQMGPAGLVLTHTERTSVKLNLILHLCGFKVATVVHRNTYKNKVFKGYKRYVAMVLEGLSWIVARYICPVSSELGDELKALLPIINKKVVPLPNYINNDIVISGQSALYRKGTEGVLRDEPNVFTICTFIRLDYAKGVDFFGSFSFKKLLALLMRCVRDTPVTTFKIVFYGLKGDNKFMKLKSGYAVELVYVPKYKPGVGFLSNADLYIQPSRYEAFGIGVTDAVVSGVPTLTSGIPVFRSMLNGISFNSSCIKWRTEGWSISRNDLHSFLASLTMIDSPQVSVEVADFVERNSDQKLLENLRLIMAD